MKSHWIGAAIGALAGLGLAATAQASPAGLARAATVASESAPVVTPAHGRHWRRHRHHRRYYRRHRPHFGFYFGAPYYGYYGWVAPRRYYHRPYYYRPYYYGYYGYRPYYRPGFSIWW
jgi:hypothetical protein